MSAAPVAWSGYSGQVFNSLIVNGQAILPGSMWTPIAYFLIDDVTPPTTLNPDDPPVYLSRVTVSFSNAPVAPQGTPPIRPGDIAAVALARESQAANANSIYTPTGVGSDPIISIATFPADSLTATIYLTDEDQLAADASLQPPLQSVFYVLVATSPTIQDSARFYPTITLEVDNVAAGAPANALSRSFNTTLLHVVNNIADMRPVREGLTGDGIPLVRFDEPNRGEQVPYPGLFPLSSGGHPDARAIFTQPGRVPQIWPAGSALEPLLALELGGGYGTHPNVAEVNARLRGIVLEITSIGRHEQNLPAGTTREDEQSVVWFNQVENRNDDMDYFIDNPGPDRIIGPNPANFGNNDDPGTPGYFDAGVDFVYYDDGLIPGQLDIMDTVPANYQIKAGFDDRLVQKRMKNDDNDFWIDDIANTAAEATGTPNIFDPGIDIVVRDVGDVPGILDPNDLIYFRGYSGEDNPFEMGTVMFPLIDEEFEDGIDNDFDGLVDEDLNYVPLQPLIDEEILDYYVDEPMGPNVPSGVQLVDGRFDFRKANYRGRPMELGTQGAFGPRFEPYYSTPSHLVVGNVQFRLSNQGDIPYDEYYIDFNANGIYDVGGSSASGMQQDECIWPGFDGIPSLRQGDRYSQRATPIDNDGDGEDDDGNPLTPPRPDGIDNDGDSEDSDGDGYVDGQEAMYGTDPHDRNSYPSWVLPLPPEYFIDEGFNEDVGDAAFTFEDYEGSGTVPRVHGFQIYRDNGDGIFDPTTDILISDSFSEVLSNPTRGALNHRANFPKTLVRINIPDTANNILKQTDDLQYDFFIAMKTDDDDNDTEATGSTTRGLSYGDDWTVKVGKYNIQLSDHAFAYSAEPFPQQITALNPMPAGRPSAHKQTKANYGRFYMSDVIGYIPSQERGGLLYGMPYLDASSSYVPVLGMNIATARNDDPVADTSGGQTGQERLVSVRVNFMNTDLEGEGRFTPSDLAALSETFTSGVALFADHPNQGVPGRFDYDMVNDRPIDTLIPINNPVWDEDPSDPVVQAGGHYVVLRPNAAVQLPIRDDTPQTEGYDFFVAVRSSNSIDYNDGFRVFIRDGDVQFSNSRNVVNTHKATTPIAANVPTILTDLTKPSPQTDKMPIAANSNPTAVMGINLHDANRTFDGQPSKLRTVRVYFDNVPNPDGVMDNDFTPRDLKDVFWGPQDAFRQWSVFDPATGRIHPYPSAIPGGRIVSNSGVALYRDMPNSDTIGGFDDPMDPAVINPDVPVLLSGLEDWNFLGGFTYNVDLVLDPPRYEGGIDVSPVDPYDPDPYETLPDSDTGLYAGDDFYVVIRTSESISYGDDFTVGVRVETGNNLGGTPPITFYPHLTNSALLPYPITPPFRQAHSFESLTTKPLFAPMVTITSYRDLIGANNRQDALSGPFPVFGINTYDNAFGNESLTSVRLEVRSISGFTENGLNPLSGDLLSGLLLYEDNPNAGIPGQFDPADIFIPIRNPVFLPNFFADNPGPDGIYGTWDDPGTPGVYDEGIDEVFLDDGSVDGFVDLSDTLIDAGTNKKQDTPPGAPLYPLRDQPGVAAQWSVYLRPTNPPGIPPNDVGVNQGPDFFVAARTSTDINYLDQFSFRLATDGVFFSSGRSFASSAVMSQPVTANVPLLLEDVSPGTFTSVEDRRAVIAVHAVNTSNQPVTLRNITLRFASLDDNDFSFTDLAALRTNLGANGELTSGISVWRNTTRNRTFDYNPNSPAQGDTFIPLTSIPQFVGDGADPYARFSVTLSLNQGSPHVLLPSEGSLDDGIPDYFIVLKPSNTAAFGDDFTVSINPGDIVFGQGAASSGKSITTRRNVFNVNTPPFFSFRVPFYGAAVPHPVSGGNFRIEWIVRDPDDNAQIHLFYFRDEGEPYPGDAQLIRITPPDQPIFEDSPNGDRYDWDVSNIPAGVLFRLLAEVNDGFNAPLRVVSGSFIIHNEEPTIQIIDPAVDVLATRDTYSTVWEARDPDNVARINLYLDTQNTEPEGSPDMIQVAQGIPHNPDQLRGTYAIPIGQLLDQGVIEAQQPYYVRATITDGVPRGEEGVIPVSIAYSPGRLIPVIMPGIEITQPAALQIVNAQTIIEWRETIPSGDDATIELYWSEGTFGAEPGEPIDDGIDTELIADQLIISSSSSVLHGRYLWNLMNEEMTGFAEGIPVGKTVYIYAQIVDELGNVRGTFSRGQLRIDEHFLVLLEPADQIPSATVTEDEPFTIRWNGYSGDPNATISLYRARHRSTVDADILLGLSEFGMTIEARNIPLTAGEYIWNVTGVPLGSYYIFAVLKDAYNDPNFVAFSDGIIRVGQVVGWLAGVSKSGKMSLSGGGLPEFQPELPTLDGIRNAEFVSAEEGLYFLEGTGRIFRQDGTSLEASRYFGWDVARDIEVRGDGKGMYILDALGGIHALEDAPLFGAHVFGWDIARDLELTPSEKGYYVMDGFGGIHAFGDAVPFKGPFFTWDIARDLEVLPDGAGLYILDGLGGVHPLGDAEFHGQIYFGWDIARDMQVSRSGQGYIIMDGYGAMYSFGDANIRERAKFTLDVAQDMTIGKANLFLNVTAVQEWTIGEGSGQLPDTDPAIAMLPDQSGESWLLWVDETPGTGTGRDIYFLNTATGERGPLVLAARSQNNPAVDGNQAVWTSNESGDRDIYMVRDLEQFIQLPLAERKGERISFGPQNQDRAAISKGIVVWEDFDLVNGDWDIFLYNSNQLGASPILITPNTDGSDQQNPTIFTTDENEDGTREVFVAWEDNRNGSNNLDIFMFHGILDQAGTMIFSQTLGFATAPRNQYQPELQYNPFNAKLVLAYTDNSYGDLNIFIETIDMKTLEVVERRTVPSAGANNPDVPVNVNPQFLPVVSEERVAWIDRRSGFWDVYMLDYRVFSLRRDEPDGEVRITGRRQRVSEIAAAGDKLVWLESEGNTARLMLGTIEIQQLPSRQVFSSAKAGRLEYVTTSSLEP